jgi:hypothetical protein
MKALRVIASVLLSLLLFVCLIAMGVAVTVNSTALSPRFVTTQIDRLDVVSLFNEQLLPELQKSQELSDHPEVITAIQNTVVKDSPAVKAAIDHAVNDIYAYLLHGGALDLRLTLKNSVLDPKLAISIINDVDLSPIIDSLLVDQLPLASADVAGFNIDLTPYVPAITAVVQPWFKGQLAQLLPQVYDYILGYTSALNTDLPISGVLNDIHSSLKAAVLASPPSAISILTKDQLSQAFDSAWTNLLPQLPATLSVSSEIGFEQPSQITQSLDDVQTSLADARAAIVTYQQVFWGLVALILVIVAMIIVVNRDVKNICRILGSVLVPYGVIEAGGLIAARVAAHSRLVGLSDMPQALRPWVLQLADAATNPLLIFALACAVLGIVLFVFSFIYKGRATAQPS